MQKRLFRFKGKRSVDWDDVKGYLEEYVGQFFQIASSEDIIYIGNKLPDEFTGSKYTRGLKGTAAKAKAKAAQGIPKLIEIATDKHFKENQGNKHQSTRKKLKPFAQYLTDMLILIWDRQDCEIS